MQAIEVFDIVDKTTGISGAGIDFKVCIGDQTVYFILDETRATTLIFLLQEVLGHIHLKNAGKDGHVTPQA